MRTKVASCYTESKIDALAGEKERGEKERREREGGEGGRGERKMEAKQNSNSNIPL